MKIFKILVCAFFFLCSNYVMAGILLMQYKSGKVISVQ